MAPKTGMTWDAAADRKLLLAILKEHNISVNHEAVAKYMTTDEQECTVSAIQNRIKKLKAMVKDGGCAAAGGDDGDATPKAKERKRANTSAAEGGTPAKKAKSGKRKASPVDDAEDDEEPAIEEEISGGKVKDESEE